MIEIATDQGVVTSTSSALAEAMAELLNSELLNSELLAHEHRGTEADLLEAVGCDLSGELPSGPVDSSFAPRTAA